MESETHHYTNISPQARGKVRTYYHNFPFRRLLLTPPVPVYTCISQEAHQIRSQPAYHKKRIRSEASQWAGARQGDCDGIRILNIESTTT